MEGLSALIQTFSNLFVPVFEFIIWAFPVKVAHLHNGEKGCITTFGKTRRKNFQKGPGLVFYYAFEQLIRCQALGGFVDMVEQTIITKDGNINIFNGAIIYDVIDTKRALLEIESLEDIIGAVAMNEFRELARTMTLEDIANADKLTAKLSTKINRKVKKFGVVVNEVIISDARPHEFVLICNTIEKVFNEKKGTNSVP